MMQHGDGAGLQQEGQCIVYTNSLNGVPELQDGNYPVQCEKALLKQHKGTTLVP